MQNSEDYIKRIAKLLNNFRSYIKSINKIRFFDTNKKSENFYRDLLKFYDNDYKRLRNINEENPDASSIDLIDDKSNVAIQVTSRTDTKKIHDTIKGFNDNYKTLKRVIILLIADSKQDYPKTDFTKKGKYVFDKKRDIIDIDDLIIKFNTYNAEQLEPIVKLLEKELSYMPLFFNANQEANRDILSEIFEFIFKNFELEQSETYQERKDLTHIKKKIPLNFSEEQNKILRQLFSDYFKYEYLIREFVEAEEEKPFRIDGLKNLIQHHYCEIQEITDPNTEIRDFKVFEKIARELLPENKMKPDYIFNANLIVLFFFEQCDIGKRTDDESDEQLDLFS